MLVSAHVLVGEPDPLRRDMRWLKRLIGWTLQSIVISPTKAETLGTASSNSARRWQMPARRRDENQGELADPRLRENRSVHSRIAVLNVAKSSARSGGGDLL